MTIGVQSYPELYTMLIGWNLYDQLWHLLSQTGVAFVPFLGIVLRNIVKPYESQEAKDAASTSLRRMEVDIIATILLIFLGVAPVISLSPSALSYTPTCQAKDANTNYTPGNTQTTWDNAFTIPNQAITVPLWWYAVLSISEGFASSANAMLACQPDLRKMVTEVNVTQISDPTLKQEVMEFANDCFIPARNQYFQDTQNNNSNALSSITDDRKQFGSDDTDWLGSHSYQDTYYKNLRAQQPVPGFTYTPANDINADTDKTNPPAYDSPNCYEWWNDPQSGLRTRLYAALPAHFKDDYASFFAKDTDGHLQDDVIKRVITNTDTGYTKGNTTVGDWGYSHIAAALGSWLTQLNAYPKLYTAAEAAPIIQALLLLLAYTFLPFALVFSGYKPKAFIAGATIIFSLIFWSFIWHLVTYVDTTLMNALYGNSWFSEQSPSATLADIIAGTLIVIAPLFWFSFMSVMGVLIGDVVTRAFGGLSQVGDQAANEGTQAVKSFAKEAISTAKKSM